MRKLPLFLIFIFVFFLSISVVKPYPLLAQEETTEEEFEYIIPENNIFCNDFLLNDYHRTETSGNPDGASLTSESPSCGNPNANIELLDEKTKQPDFSALDSRLQLTMPKLMPLRLREKVSLDQEEIETRAKHFWVNNEPIDSCNYDPQSSPETPVEIKAGVTQVTLKEWWASLLSGTKIFCGLFSASEERCIPPEKLALRIERTDPGEIEKKIDISNPNSDYYLETCEKSTKEPTKEISPKLITDDEDRIVNFFSRLIEKIFSKSDGTQPKTTEETASLTNKTRGVMVGGLTLINQSEFLSNFISHSINSSIAKSPLVSNAEYEIEGEGGIGIDNEEEANKEHYQEQNLVKGRNCLQLCALYPPKADFDISKIDPLCTSCDPKDYKAEE